MVTLFPYFFNSGIFDKALPTSTASLWLSSSVEKWSRYTCGFLLGTVLFMVSIICCLYFRKSTFLCSVFAKRHSRISLGNFFTSSNNLLVDASGLQPTSFIYLFAKLWPFVPTCIYVSLRQWFHYFPADLWGQTEQLRNYVDF